MAKIDYAFKAHILNDMPDLIKLIDVAKKQDFSRDQLEELGVVNWTMKHYNHDVDSYSDILFRFHEYGLIKEFLEAKKINHANHNRAFRLHQRIAEMLEAGPCLFATLTFRDDRFIKTNAKTRRNAVSRYLKAHNCKYVANIDFGEDENCTHREHYHALVQTDFLDYEKWFNKNGCIKIERIKRNTPSALAKYISKLTNHAIKETTRRSVLLYSR